MRFSIFFLLSFIFNFFDCSFSVNKIRPCNGIARSLFKAQPCCGTCIRTCILDSTLTTAPKSPSPIIKLYVSHKRTLWQSLYLSAHRRVELPCWRKTHRFGDVTAGLPIGKKLGTPRIWHLCISVSVQSVWILARDYTIIFTKIQMSEIHCQHCHTRRRYFFVYLTFEN